MIDYKIQSILVALVLGFSLDLDYLKKRLSWQIRTIQRHILTFQMQSPKATIMIYKSGKIAIAGVKSFDEVHQIRERILDELTNIGISIPQDPDLVVWNIVGTADIGLPIDIETISEKLYKDT